jgi:hypothetical protein
MGIIGLIFLLVALGLIGVGIALGLVACLLAALLLGMGILSTSVMVGFLSRSRARGVRALLLQVGLFSGIPAGVACAWLGRTLVTGENGGWPVVFCGAIAGALAGVVVALLLDFASHRLHRWALDRMKPAGKNPPEGVPPQRDDSGN